MLEICKRKGRLKWFVKQPYPPLAQVAYSSRICSEYLYKKKEEKLTLEDQVFRLILRINSSELYSNIYGSASTHMICLPSFLPLHFQVWNSLKTAFWERKLLLLHEKRRFWTRNFCCSEKNGVFGQETFVARGKSEFFSIFKTSLPFITKKTTEADISRGFIFFPAALASCGFEFKIFCSLISFIELMREFTKEVLIELPTI